MTLEIRTALLEDAASIAKLAERTFRETFAEDNTPEDMEAYVGEAFSVERLAAELAEPASTFFLAFVEGEDEPIGYAKLRQGPVETCVTGPEPVELERLYVERRALGRGVGAALMQASLRAARSRGYRTLWLGVWERNERALAFYQRWGFEIVGSHVFRVGSDDQTDLVMERSISETPLMAHPSS